MYLANDGLQNNRIRRLPEPEEKLYVRCSGKKYDEKSLFIKKDVQQNIKFQPEYTKSKFSNNHDTPTKIFSHM